MRKTRSLLHHIVICACLVILPLDANAHFAQQPADSTSAVVYEIGDGVAAPKPVSTPNPEYSDKARKKKINGTVIVAMIVTPDGRVRDVKVIQSLERSLDQQAINAVRAWKFEPAMKDGNPVAVHMRAEVSFRVY